MGYLHIENLYKNQTVLMFRECYALEKVHGTSAHIGWKNSKLRFFAGGANHEAFVKLFDPNALSNAFLELGQEEVVVYGEAYGGKMQGMKETYGPNLRFIVFDVKIGNVWLNVPNAEDVAFKLGLEFVPWVKTEVSVAALDAIRDTPSEVAKRCGMGEDKPREGVVLRPLQELTTSNGDRIISKHKSAIFSETRTPRVIGQTLEYENAEKAAKEWVTPMRLRHVLDKMGNPCDMAKTPEVIRAMLEDVLREGSGEIEDTKELRKAVGKASLVLWKRHAQRIEETA